MTHTSFNTIKNAFSFIMHSLRSIALLILVTFLSTEAIAVVAITKATGGTLISADRSENANVPMYTTLGNVVISEGATNDFAVGTNVTLTVIAPSGW